MAALKLCYGTTKRLSVHAKDARAERNACGRPPSLKSFEAVELLFLSTDFGDLKDSSDAGELVLKVLGVRRIIFFRLRTLGTLGTLGVLGGSP